MFREASEENPAIFLLKGVWVSYNSFPHLLTVLNISHKERMQTISGQVILS